MSQGYPPISDFPMAPLATEYHNPTDGADHSRSRGNGFRSCLVALVILLAFLWLATLLVAVGLWFLVAVGFGWSLRPGPEMPPRLREQFVSHEKRATDRVAIISLEGMILDEEQGFVKRQIDQAMEDERVKAVVLRVNSPGGTITDSDFLYHYLSKLRERKPLVVSMGAVAASGGYYVSMAVGHHPDTIFAEPTTWTGSIGVLIFHMNVQELLGRLGVEASNITSAPLKDMGSIFRKMTEEERRLFQSLVDKSLDRFKEVIRSGRQKFHEDPAALEKIATGQIFTAQEALELGLVDRIGFLEDAVSRAIELARLDPREVCVIRYQPPVALSDLFWGRTTVYWPKQFEIWARWRTLLAAEFPRAYYLMGSGAMGLDWLPISPP
jgi:protease-4